MAKMKMSKKPRKDCLGCKCDEEYGCQLGYETTTEDMNVAGFGAIFKRVPLEPCPKPKTNYQWIKARRIYRAH